MKNKTEWKLKMIKCKYIFIECKYVLFNINVFINIQYFSFNVNIFTEYKFHFYNNSATILKLTHGSTKLLMADHLLNRLHEKVLIFY